MKKIILLFLLSFNVVAHDFHHETTGTVINNMSAEGVALSLAASQHHFDFGTQSWQGSVGAGHFKDDTAFSFGVGKRFDRVLINGSVGVEDNELGLGAGINWRF